MKKGAIINGILDAVVQNLEKEPSIKFGKRITGENASVQMQSIWADGEEYLVVAKKVGGV